MQLCDFEAIRQYNCHGFDLLARVLRLKFVYIQKMKFKALHFVIVLFTRKK